MFPNNYFQRLELWRNLRTKIETASSPFDIVFDFWNSVPTDSISADPYDKNSWPDPWEMIKENTYCEFGKILAIMYTLQLTERFSQATFEIHITLDKDKSRFVYLLSVDNTTIGIYNNGYVNYNKQNNLVPQMQYSKLPQYN
jgi:hypothetical protein|tara:strand:+ start:2194 stop:2619 length:426 start_codon:yes stop_codon:yes gene_type:complete